MSAAVAADRIRNPLDPRNPLAGLYVATTLFELAEGALRFLVPINLHGRGLAPSAIGFVIFVFSLTSLLSRGVTAAIYRRDRARRLIVVAGLASTLAYLVTPFVGDVWAFTLLMAFDGFGWGVATTCLLAVMMTSTPTSVPSAVAMGWYVGFQGIAFALATTVGGLLAEVAGVQVAMLVLATLPVLGAVFIALRLPRPAGGRPADQAPAEDEATRRSLRAARLRIGLVPAAVWAATVVALYLNVMNGLLQSFFPLLGLALGLSLAEIGTLSSVRSAVSAVSRFGAGWIFARLAPSRLHLPLLAMSALTVALLPSAPAYLVLLPLFAMNGISRGLLRVTTGAAAMDSTPAGQAGAAAALMTAGLDVGKMIGPLAGGLVATAIGLEAMFRIVPLTFLVTSIVVYLVVAGRRRRSTPLATSR